VLKFLASRSYYTSEDKTSPLDLINKLAVFEILGNLGW